MYSNSSARNGLTLAVLLAVSAELQAGEGQKASIDQAIAADRDVWAEQAIALPGGPSYEFFASLLPPLRYVDADFLNYPIVLAAPQAKNKARLISNGSAINALARMPNWRGETGTPVTFRVGVDRQPYGQDATSLTGPTYRDGYLPIVQLAYRHQDANYHEEVFAPTDAPWAKQGAALVRFLLDGAQRGNIEARIEGTTPLTAKDGVILSADQKVIAQYQGNWTFNVARNTLYGTLTEGMPLTLAILTEPADAPLTFSGDTFDALQQSTIATWQHLLADGAQIDVPEPVVNNAWKSLVIGTYEVAADQQMNYSAGNQYAKVYVAEGSDAIRSLALYGHVADAQGMLGSVLDVHRKGLEFHQAAFKLQMLAQHYWLTRDRDWLASLKPVWQKEIDVLLAGREASSGLLPREKYCGDIETRVISLNSNANAWRALRDWSVVLADSGDVASGDALRATAHEFREKILAAIEHAKQPNVTPPFLPVALSGEEPAYARVIDSRMGSYWNIMSSYVLASGVFRYDSQTAGDLIAYVQSHAGRLAGLNRSTPNPSFWVSTDGLNDLYGLRYTLTLLERDEADQALVGLYGKLALGLTRDTFIGGEGSAIRPLDAFGRQFYLPPNTAANANFLTPLRYTLVQDWDLNDDGVPDTLRLAFATPRRWLEDGKMIRVTNAPTAFGPVSYTIESKLSAGQVIADITLPPRKPDQTLLRFRVPAGWKLTAAAVNDVPLPQAGEDSVDLTGLIGKIQVIAHLRHQ